MIVPQLRSFVMGAIVFVVGFTILAGEESFVLTSKTFKNGEKLPAKVAMKAVHGGRNLSPELSWRNAPKGTKFFALSCVDTNPVAKRWVHWMVLNIPVKVTNLPEIASPGAMPKGCVELKNSYGFKGYGGPQPPRETGGHSYVFTLYALKGKIDTKESFLSEKQLKKLVKPLFIAKTRLIGTFER